LGIASVTASDNLPLALILYTGPHCELCDHALKVYAQVNPEQTRLEKVNIRSDAQLYHLYGARIPVLKRNDNQRELGWPFDAAMLEQFLR
jgi:hypothetical protein